MAITPDSWANPITFSRAFEFKCGHCNLHVASNRGWSRVNTSPDVLRIVICPKCGTPSYFEGEDSKQVPGASFGEHVTHLPPDIAGLYAEARNCHSVDAFTAGAMACRKILMNLAVHKGAGGGKSFSYYVGYLEKKGYVPPAGKRWVHYISRKGKEAAHEIPATTKADLEDLLTFLGTLLRIIFEFPARFPAPAAAGSNAKPEQEQSPPNAADADSRVASEFDFTEGQPSTFRRARGR